MTGYTAILPEEFDALIGVSDGAFRLYMSLRRFMHRADGCAFGRGVTWPELRTQDMYVTPRSGVQNTGSTYNQRLYRLRDELIRAGLIEDLGDKKSFLKFRFPVFLRFYTAPDYSDQKQAVPNPYPHPVPNPYTDSSLNSDGYEYVAPEAVPPKNTQAVPSPISHILTGSNSKYSSSLKEQSNYHANFTDLQKQYFEIIASTNLFTLHVLLNPQKQEEYNLMLRRWESAHVPSERLLEALLQISDDATRRQLKIHSPLYFAEPVLRLLGVNHASYQSSHRQGRQSESDSERQIRLARAAGIM